MTPPPASHDSYGALHDAAYDGEGDQPLVRPYAMTGGRTRPRYQLAIEALVSTTADPAHLATLLGGRVPRTHRVRGDAARRRQGG
ncbi:DUF742 domain-containing protein, partial [Streptomyces hundungensis]|uniref:DUF742 domain-containing protein n=1 Tax=Streptomyces hundungensis TaxID=1077946 RepID=UPI0033FA6371